MQSINKDTRKTAVGSCGCLSFLVLGMQEEAHPDLAMGVAGGGSVVNVRY